MSYISKIKTIDGTTYDLKDDNITENRIKPIETHTYSDFIATANSQQGAGFFFLKERCTSYHEIWRVKLKIHVIVPGNVNYNSTTITEIWGTTNTYLAYRNQNVIRNTSARPVYYVSAFCASELGYNNGCGTWIGISLYQSNNPTNTSFKRNLIVELLDYENCALEFSNNLIMPDNIPDRAAHTNWYTSVPTSYANFDFCSNGLKAVGDANTTTISRLYNYYTYYIADSAVYRYQLLFTMSEDRVTPLNNIDNTVAATKTMLTDIEFDPFGRIYFYNSTTNISANGRINNSGPAFMWDLFDARYTFNLVSGTATETAMNLVANKNVYIKLSPQSNGKVKLASAIPLVQELPNEADGYWYLFLGRQYDWYRMTLFSEHPVYEFYNGKIRQRMPDISVSEFTGSGSNLTNLNASNISSGTISVDRIPNLDAGKIASGALSADRIPSLPASQISSGTFSTDRIPNIDASKIASGTLNASRLPSSGVTAGSYGPSSNASPAFGGTFSVPSITVDTTGRATAASTKTITLPTYSAATSSANGLMSATDKSKLDNLSTIQLSTGIDVTEGTDGLIFTYVGSDGATPIKSTDLATVNETIAYLNI